MIASLPMYDFPELRPVTDAFWSGLRRHFLAAGLDQVPRELTRPQDIDVHWRQSDLLFSQTCGYPLTHALAGQVQVLATPCYRADGCVEATYCSVIVVRGADCGRKLAELSGCTIAVNGFDSQSGYNALRFHLTTLGLEPGFLRHVVESGTHRKSVALVREGKADLCAVDCVSWALLSRIAPRETAGLAVIDRTESAPSLPFITAGTSPAEIASRLRKGLIAAFADPALKPALDPLLLHGVAILPDAAYDEILHQERVVRARSKGLG